jgi:hypothetical protein
MARLRDGWRGNFRSIAGRSIEIFLFFTASRPTVGSAQLPIQWTPGAFSRDLIRRKNNSAFALFLKRILWNWTTFVTVPNNSFNNTWSRVYYSITLSFDELQVFSVGISELLNKIVSLKCLIGIFVFKNRSFSILSTQSFHSSRLFISNKL